MGSCMIRPEYRSVVYLTIVIQGVIYIYIYEWMILATS